VFHPSQRTISAHGARKNTGFQGDKARQNGDNPPNSCFQIPSLIWELASREPSTVIASRPSALVVAALAACAVLTPVRAQAQWWRSAPVDFEECADRAEKAATKEAKTSALAECNAKFAGRRKPGGGYTYYDFMQDRTFDIAGPNPTPEEQKKIDEQYTAYLENQRRNSIAAAFTAKQHQQQESQQGMQQVSLRSETEKVPVPVASPVKQAARIKASNCAKNAFSCEWPRLSDGINEFKKLFGASPNKAKRS
jgi:hypothetical protein